MPVSQSANSTAGSGVNLAVAALWLLVIVSALAVVASTHETRNQVDRLETLRRDAAELQVVWGQYMLEQSTWAAYSRIERLARDDLDMYLPRLENIVMVVHE